MGVKETIALYGLGAVTLGGISLIALKQLKGIGGNLTKGANQGLQQLGQSDAGQNLQQTAGNVTSIQRDVTGAAADVVSDVTSGRTTQSIQQKLRKAKLARQRKKQKRQKKRRQKAQKREQFISDINPFSNENIKQRKRKKRKRKKKRRKRRKKRKEKAKETLDNLNPFS